MLLGDFIKKKMLNINSFVNGSNLLIHNKNKKKKTYEKKKKSEFNDHLTTTTKSAYKQSNRIQSH